MEKKQCPECGEPIIGRIDKKFCSDQCRTAFFNKQNKDSSNYMRNVNRILRKNRQILAELNPEGKTKVKRRTLEKAGFDFEFMTSLYKTEKGTVYYFCYEEGYLELENDFFILVRKNS